MALNRPAFWQKRGLVAILLLPLAALFAFISSFRRFLYRAGVFKSFAMPVPVIIVGNIAVGGSGKTPVVVWLVAQLRAAGMKPGIVTRGYKGKQQTSTLVPANGDPAVYGDEAVLLAQLAGCPVASGADRPVTAARLLENHPECDVIVCDDGMQHYALRRTIEIAVVDENVLGNRWLLPAGPLRESIERLASVDFIIAHGPLSSALKAQTRDVPVFAMTLQGDRFLALNDSSQTRDAASFCGRPVHAIAGIGRPERFFAQLESMGLEVIRHPFPDHHRFVRADIEFAPGETKIMTSKDAVKCRIFAPYDAWEFAVTANIENGAAQRILEKLDDGCKTA